MRNSVSISEVQTGPMAATVDKSENRIRQMFGEISSRYDLMNHLLSGGVDYYWRWFTIRRCQIRNQSPILDVCTGTGDLAIAFWKHSQQQIPVIGTDFTHEMLAIARKKTSKNTRQPASSNSSPITFIEADTQALPFEANQFQLVSVAFGLRNVTRMALGLEEMTRVCQPGGQVAILEFSLPGNPIIRNIYCWYFRNILPRIGQWLARNRQAAYDYLPSSVAEFPYGEALAEHMRSAGLINVKFWSLTLGIATLYIGQKPDVGHRAE
ncbi:bifunctional demethylmenaquinone methyltransferase/2-methoxy-6-polyprenyl-1,4-benzoquinol methylase UbiE [Planctopirus hydrillae]|uniref:Demethylmenaquinone methyltransferase n=1 Tax=Planctopirus hydrillae TaxID=1841610 RepID=A0A1C3E465_9PLAN|nr:bifunctional demethylmenaquinone methyltransferase/2-methoxy-6-polyprenyl-1,4-benzoquinol methylase UbiE [Planctopirus hydrillae]ODA28042.1 bifunctional demethylmenaquinone methyltransferase/2-methoxy-6-polyprenyl-1,4-benzoquinol methylase [Planctopirus hydrillae]